MKNKGLLILYFLCLATLLTSCGSVRRMLAGSKDSPKLYPIIQGMGPNVKFGYINTKGEVVIQPQFKQAWFFSEGLAVACIEHEKCGYIDETGKFIINPQFQLASRFVDGIAGVIAGDKIGYIDKTGKYLINPQFDFPRGGGDWQIVLSIFNEDLASVKTGEKTGYIDKSGKYVINPQFDIGLPFMEGLAAVMIGEKWGFVDKTGKIVINPQFERAQPFVNGLAAVKIGNQWGYVDKTGKIIINPQFDFAAPFAYEGAAVVFLKDKAGYIDKDGKYLVNPQYSIPPSASRDAEAVLLAAYTVTSDLGRLSASEGLALVNAGGSSVETMKFGYADGSGEFKINPQFMLASPFFGELALVLFDRQEFGWINKEGKIVWRLSKENPQASTNTKQQIDVSVTTPTNTNRPVANTNTMPAQAEQSGRLATDSNIRSEANKDAASLGIHFKNAKIKILDEKSYLRDGENVTWYRIQVTEYGCSVDANLGCGKNSPSDSDEGWVNAKNILLD